MHMRAVNAPLLSGALFLFLCADLTGQTLFSSVPTDARASSSPESPYQAVHRKPKRASLRTFENARATYLCGIAVENKDGQAIGRLEDFIVDLQSGQVTYALLSSGGFLGLRKHLKII